jgi:hypothetical protein
MFSRILAGAPVWVWPLLVLLVVLGIVASRDRTRSAVPMYFLWLPGLLSVRSVYALDAPGSVWAVFGGACLAGAWLGDRFQRRIIVAKQGAMIKVRGEWLTLGVMMVIFWMNFASGVVRAISPETVASPVYMSVFAVLAGLAAGSFSGRSLRTFLMPSQGDVARP